MGPKKRFSLIVAVSALLQVAVPGPIRADTEALATDEKLLSDAGLRTDAAGLLGFFRQRTLSDADQARLAAKVRFLGDRLFQVLEKTTQELIAAGRLALPFLRLAVHDVDLEIARRAEHCLRVIEQGPGPALAEAAARLLAERKPAGSLEVLLAYLPFADDDNVEAEVLLAVAATGLHDGKPDALLVAAVTAKEPLRRLAAAFVLGRAGPEQREAVRRLLNDPQPNVRFTAARELLRAGDKSAVPALLALLEQTPEPLATQSEELLVRIAGDLRPAVDLDLSSESSRRECRKAWEGWWKVNHERIDLPRAALEERELGFTVVADLDRGHIAEYGADKKERWRVEGFRGPVDVQVLRNGNVLVAENHASQVTERDRTGKIVWQKHLGQLASSAQRLPNGNTFIAAYNRIIEVQPDGKEVLDISWPQGVYSARKLRNGQMVVLTAAGKLLTLDAKGKELKSLNTGGITGWSSLAVLTNGHFLICGHRGSVVEFDRSGRKVWECNAGPGAVSAARKANGNTLICISEGRKVVEVNRAGKVVRELRTEGRPWHVERR